MHAQHSLIEILAQAMIAFLFLYRGIGAIPRFDRHKARLAAKSVPAAGLVLACGLGLMLGGATLVLLDIFAALGAAMLIVFTIAASVIYHDFWSVGDADRRRREATRFAYNVAVIGGLLLVAF
ncbi:MAG: DoxX family protein [Alphaproteobacteria bacterium]|nr:DoxX family protein [Alphaproteobacteria bacterium]